MKHLRSTCVPLAFLAAAMMCVGQSRPAQSAKIWSATPSAISAYQSITPTDSLAHAGSSFSLYFMASDFDYWIETPNTGSSADQLNYTWSTDSGSVSSGVFVTWSLAANAKGLNSCTVVVDDVAAVWSPDTGSRNDAPVTLTKQVGVPTSEVDITTCASTAAGLHEIQYTTTKYAATQQSLVLEYRENNSPYVTDWATITETPELLSTTTDAHSVETKTYKVMWNTLPLHNSHYEVRLRAVYTWGCHSETQNLQTSARGVDVNNLNISASSPDYLRWAPLEGNTPQAITATLSDGGGLTNTSVNIQIYNSDRVTYPNALRTVTYTTNDANISYQWNGKDNSGVDCPVGIYIYKITASHSQTAGTDTISDTSPTGQITSVASQDAVGNTLPIKAICNTQVTNGNIHLFTPILTLFDQSATSVYGPNSVLTQIGQFSYYAPSMAGDYTCLVTGYDSSSVASDKSYTMRKVLALSSYERAVAMNIYLGPDTVYGSDATDLWSYALGQQMTPSSGTRKYKFANGWEFGPATQYVYGTFPEQRTADVVKNGLLYGQPVGPFSRNPQSTNNDATKYSSVVWVLYGHGSASGSPSELAIRCSNSAPMRIVASDITSQPNMSTVEYNRLAVLFACNDNPPWRNTYALQLPQCGWNVICTDEPNALESIAYYYSMHFLDSWSSASYSMGNLSQVQTNALSAFSAFAIANGWPPEMRVHVNDYYLTARQ